tara:strand:+ start:228 stop:440 length:213 start_codon:yes stop_codon:yes gene_type:complete
MKTKQIYIIIGVIIGVGLLIWLITYMRKTKDISQGNPNNGSPNYAGNGWNFEVGSGNNGGVDWNVGGGGS